MARSTWLWLSSGSLLSGVGSCCESGVVVAARGGARGALLRVGGADERALRRRGDPHGDGTPIGMVVVGMGGHAGSLLP